MTPDAGRVPAPGSDAAELPYQWWVCLGHAAYYTDVPPARCPICGGPITPEQQAVQLALDNLTMRPRTAKDGRDVD